MAPVHPEEGQHNLPVPALLLWPQGTLGWVGFSAPLLLGRWVMLLSSLGSLLLVLLPQQNRGCRPCVRPRSPFPAPVTHSSSCHLVCLQPASCGWHQLSLPALPALPAPVAVPRGQLLGPSSRQGLRKGGPGSLSPVPAKNGHPLHQAWSFQRNSTALRSLGFKGQSSRQVCSKSSPQAHGCSWGIGVTQLRVALPSLAA